VQAGAPQRGGLPANEPAPDQSPSTDPAMLHKEALLALEAGDTDAAFYLGRQAMRLAPDNPQVVFLMAMVLGNRKRFPEAIEMLDELAQTNPSLRLPVMGQTAEWMVRFGQWSEAENRYRAILDEVPDSVQVHRNLAQLMLRQGRPIEAAQQIRYLCQLGDVKERELRSLLIIVHPFPGDAIKEEFDPVGSLGKARNEIGRGDWQAARKRLEALDSIGSEESALLGRIYVNLNDFEAVEKWIATTSDSGERHADAWLAKGAYAAQQGDHANAIRCFAETVLRDQTDHQAYSLMSQSLNKLNARKEAAEALHRADLIKQTQTLGAEIASSEMREDKEIAELIDLLDQLHRPLEALAWRGMQLDYARATSSVSDAESQQILSEIVADRSKELAANRGQATRQFILCGVDPNALP
jgi:tetratricopeptide (TPR) repeat protein